MKVYGLLIPFLLLMFSCKDMVPSDDSTTLINEACPNAVVVDSDSYASFPNDAALITSVAIDGDCLLISVQYGGGCEDLEYNVVGQGAVMQSSPVQRDIRFSFSDTDNCEALVTMELMFALFPTRADGENEVILNLQGWSESLSYKY